MINDVMALMHSELGKAADKVIKEFDEDISRHFEAMSEEDKEILIEKMKSVENGNKR